ncbi:MAG: 4-(cytidine 5'-diphospho)-2-C-methyl-D-erythritol kinase [Sedimentisphaerales bacterium]|nr:4-(cytidine 5'-diphospho)-2-C-methyl-D-erythritol kinase [Sedimentisphaerales bacterium]
MLRSVLNNAQINNPSLGVVLQPLAKLNLSLVIRYKRPDGFHELHSVMATLSLMDDLELHFSDKAGIHLTCWGLNSPSGPENIVWRAAQLFYDYTQIDPAIAMTLTKRIPAGTGLGGASSDAAACLMGLNQLCHTGLKSNQLDELAAQLGSDVSFFLHGPIALCTGRGEIVQPLKLTCTRHILLILPGIHVSTAEIYAQHCCNPDEVEQAMMRVEQCLDAGDLDALLDEGVNTLTPTTMQYVPALDELRRQIESKGIGPVCMSGSGSALFVSSNNLAQLQQWRSLLLENGLAEVHIVRLGVSGPSFREVHHANI